MNINHLPLIRKKSLLRLIHIFQNTFPKHLVRKQAFNIYFLGYADGTDGSPSLLHQKATIFSESVPQKHRISLIQSTKYRKGACDNCGSATHSRRDCLERPRKIGAKWSGKDIEADEIILDSSEKINLLPGTKVLPNYDEKRDHWKSFDSSSFNTKVEPLYEGLLSRFISKETSNEEAGGSVGQKLDFESKSRMTVRNLRIREDTVKYLQKNISEDVVYDPKTRAFISTDSNTKVQERWVRASFSESSILPTELDLFCWDPQRKSTILPQTCPTLVALEYEKYKKSIQDSKEEEITFGTSFALKEDSSSVQDSFRNGHSSIWGSFWKDDSWGYACCRSLNFNSHCMVPSSSQL